MWDTDNGLKLLIFQLSNVRELEALTLVQDRFLHYHLFYHCNYFYPLSSMHRSTTAILCNWKDFSNSIPHGLFKDFAVFLSVNLKSFNSIPLFNSTQLTCVICIFSPDACPRKINYMYLEVVWNLTISETQLNIVVWDKLLNKHLLSWVNWNKS